jgi:arsenite-transporting ATPase
VLRKEMRMSRKTNIVNEATRVLFSRARWRGKTSLACATAVALDSGKRVLLVSTDPASNLDEVLETHISGHTCAGQRHHWPCSAEYRSRGGSASLS